MNVPNISVQPTRGKTRAADAWRSAAATVMTSRVVLVLLLMLTACEAQAESQNWNFVGSVGGMRVGNAVRQHDGAVSLSVEADVSGLQRFSDTPTTMNSALACSKWHAHVATQNVELYLETLVAGVGATGSRCPRTIDLGPVKAGSYRVVYVGPDKVAHDIDTLNIP